MLDSAHAGTSFFRDTYNTDGATFAGNLSGAGAGADAADVLDDAAIFLCRMSPVMLARELSLLQRHLIWSVRIGQHRRRYRRRCGARGGHDGRLPHEVGEARGKIFMTAATGR